MLLYRSLLAPQARPGTLRRHCLQMERRDRLRKLLAGMDEQQAVAALGPPTEYEMAEVQAAVAVPTTEVFYTEGTPQLKAVRHEIARFSFHRASLRLSSARQQRNDPDEHEAVAAQAAERQLRTMANQASEIGDERPIVGCAFSPDGSQLATGAWSGTLKVWSVATLQKQLAIKAHTERITGIAWHPNATSTPGASCGLRVGTHWITCRQSGPRCSWNPAVASHHLVARLHAGVVTLATGATDASAKLWSADGNLLRTLAGHTDRLGRIAFHPMGQHLGADRMGCGSPGNCLLTGLLSTSTINKPAR